MNWYPWLNKIYRPIINAYQQGKGHHALLIHALDGNGADALCYAISRWLMCQSPDGLKSCGHCHSCRLMLAGTHPDHTVLSPEKGKTSISVDAVRKLIEKLSSHSQQGGAKVVWIPNTEALTDAAANALLKTLEEPAQSTFFILQCQRPETLLATLRSRCFYHYLAVPDSDSAWFWLHKNFPQVPYSDAVTALRLSQGAPVAAAKLLETTHWQQRQQFCHALSAALQQQDMLSLLPALNQEGMITRLYWLMGLLTDAMKYQQGAAEFCSNQDQLPLIAQLANIQAPSQLLAAFDKWQACHHQLLTVTSLNQELILTNQLLDWEKSLVMTSK